MARALDRDKAWIERLWKRLKSETMIETANEAGVTVVTICNYAKYQNIKGMREASGETLGETDVRQGRDTEQEGKKGRIEETAKAVSGVRKRATRLDEDWVPLELSERAAGVVAAWPTGMVDRELEKFRNHFTAKGGQNATKLDWQKAWINWIYTADERRPRNERDSGGPEGLARKYREERERERTTH